MQNRQAHAKEILNGAMLGDHEFQFLADLSRSVIVFLWHNPAPVKQGYEVARVVEPQTAPADRNPTIFIINNSCQDHFDAFMPVDYASLWSGGDQQNIARLKEKELYLQGDIIPASRRKNDCCLDSIRKFAQAADPSWQPFNQSNREIRKCLYAKVMDTDPVFFTQLSGQGLSSVWAGLNAFCLQFAMYLGVVDSQDYFCELKRSNSDSSIEENQEATVESSHHKPKIENIPEILQGANMLVVSNRGPVTEEGELRIAPGGLATALQGALRATAECEAGDHSVSWISYSGKTDGHSYHRTEYLPGENEHLTHPVKNPNPFRVVQFDLPSDVYSGFYNGVANDLFWPAFHGGQLFAAASITDEQWKQYETANNAYADVTVCRLEPGRPNVVWVQDYQLLLVPGMIRDKNHESAERSNREETRIGYFHHIPWADPSTLIKTLGTLEATKAPETQETKTEKKPKEFDLKLGRQRAGQIVESLLKCNLVGFQVQRDCDNFMQLVRNLSRKIGPAEGALDLPADAVNEVDGTIKLAEGRTVRVAPYPVSIKWKDSSDTGEKAADPFQIRQKLAEDLLSAGKIDLSTRQVLGRPESIFVYGIERFDYTKGLEERIEAIGNYLKYLDENNPQPGNPVVFVMTLSDTRGNIPAYKIYQHRVRNKILALNEKYREKFGFTPIIETGPVTDPDRKGDWMVNADVFLMNALKDGMNLTFQEVLAHKKFTRVKTETPDSITRRAHMLTSPTRAQHMPVVPIISSEAGIGTLDEVKMHCLMLDNPGDQAQLTERLKNAINRSAILKKDNPEGNAARACQAFENATLQHYFSHNDVDTWAALYLQDLCRAPFR